MKNDDIYSDYYRRYGSWSPKLIHKVFPFFIRPQVRHFILIRKWQKSSNRIYKLLLKARMILLSKKSFLDIPPQTSIGEGLSMYHVGRVIVNGNAKIGRNVTLSPGVVIGKSIDKKTGKEKFPVIGNFVWIGANVSIVGDVTIGNNVLISANTFVSKSIPSNSVVFGNPAIIKENKENATLNYIKNPV